MNLKTTLALLVLVAGGGALVWYGAEDAARRAATSRISESRAALEKIAGDKLLRIEIRHGDRVTILERPAGGEWTLPGGWPARPTEVKALVDLLDGLASRFEPEPFAGDLTRYGLEEVAGRPGPIRVHLRTTEGEHSLRIGEPAPQGGNRFSTPTYVFVDDIPEVLRVAPGVFAALDRPADFYQQRRLFPAERVVKEGEPGQKVERPLATAIEAEERRDPPTPAGLAAVGAALKLHPEHRDRRYRIVRAGDNWELADPVRDRLDTAPRDALLTAVPDVWAERFVATDVPAIVSAIAAPDGEPAGWLSALAWASLTPSARAAGWLNLKTGLEKPERVLTVRRADGQTARLRIGKVSSERITKRPGRPQPGMPPGFPPPEETVREEFRFARLDGNPQVFEIKADRLKDLFLDPGKLRDPRLARFTTAEARRIEIEQAGQKTVLVKSGERWKLEQPIQSDADSEKVNELLNKLTGLEVKAEAIRDVVTPTTPKDAVNAALKPFGLDSPAATVRVTVEEDVPGTGEEKKKRTRVVTLALGKIDEASKKLYVRADDWPRVNAVDDSLLPLVQRPALAYRGNKLFDFPAADVGLLTFTKNGSTVVLRRNEAAWQLEKPVKSDADTEKANQVADGLARLEVLDYLSDAPDRKRLETEFGLAKPALTLTAQVKSDKDKTVQLLIGKAREGQPGYFAKLGDSPGVFALNHDFVNLLERDALAYLPATLWRIAVADVTAISVQRPGQEAYRLTRANDGWKLAGPFDAVAPGDIVQPILDALAAPQAERYVRFFDEKALAEFGLDKPIQATLTTKDGKQHALRIGKADGEKDSLRRFAQVGAQGAICLVGEPVAEAAGRDPLTLLNPVLVQLEPGKLNRVTSRSGEATVTAEKKDNAWQVIDGPGAPFTADEQTMTALISPWLSLRAERFAAYGPKVDLGRYGLDKPAASLTVRSGAGEHLLELGKEVETTSGEKLPNGSTGGRYARLDRGAGIVVLAPATAAALARSRLDFVNRALTDLPPATVSTLVRKGGGELELARRDGAWQILKPTAEPADDPSMRDLIEHLASLRAVRIAAYPAENLAPFGLGSDSVAVTIVAGDKRTVLRIGGLANPNLESARPSDPVRAERFVQVEGSKAVAVLPGAIARKLLAAPVAFRDRTLVRFPDADRLRLERGPRRAAFTRVDGTWKLTEPLSAEADQDALDDFLNDLARLRADELVTEKATPAELQSFGLDKPLVRWHAADGETDRLHLLVGNREADGPRYYAKLADRDLVFLLDLKLSAKALGEFRTRTVWPPPLDAAQVESLRYTTPDGAFVIEKDDRDLWQIVGKPDQKPIPATVSETLAAIAGLKLVRYAVDRDGDLPLYGLAPPVLSIEVASRAGKRVLEIGRFEGESKRRYARVVDGTRRDVFIISAEDAAKIVRDAAGFTRPPLSPPPGPGRDG